MKNFLQKLSPKNLLLNLKQAFLAFPLSFLISFIIFFIFVFLIYKNFSINNDLKDILAKSIISLSLVYFLSIWVYLLVKVFDFSKSRTYLSQIFSILFWVWFYFSLPNVSWYDFFAEDFVYMAITFVWIFAFLFIYKFIKSYLKKQLDNDGYYNFFNEITGKITKTLVVWFVSMTLWSIALASIFTLFDLSSLVDEEKFYWYWVAFSFSLFAPIFFLIQAISINNDKNTKLIDDIRENKFYSFLNNYLALPFIIFYFFILYVYSIKVLINFSSWPEWIVSWMVIWFSLFWYLVFIFSYAFEEKMAIVRIFRKYFPYAVIFQTPMLFYAIYLRIKQYDFTVNRYLVVVLWIYLVIISLYFIFSKKKYLLFIPSIFALFILIISIWPWGVYNFPETRQLSKLETNLTKAWFLQKWEIILPTKAISDKKLSRQIDWQIEYICWFWSCESMKVFSKQIEEIKKEHKIWWEKNHILELEKAKNENIDKDYIVRLEKEKYPEMHYWEIKTSLQEKLKLENYYSDESLNKIEQEFIIFSYDTSSKSQIVNVKWYDYFINLSSDKNNKIINLYDVKVDFYKKKLFIYRTGILFEEIDISKQIEDFYTKNKNNAINNYTINIEKPFEITINWKKLDLKLYISYFEMRNPDYKWEKIIVDDNTFTNRFVLIKEK